MAELRQAPPPAPATGLLRRLGRNRSGAAGLLLVLTFILVALAGFFGLTPRPPAASWGVMLSESRALAERAPWLMIFPGLAIMSGVLGFNLLGDGLRDVLDPRLRGRHSAA